MLEVRHGDVKPTVERLADRGIIGRPPSEEMQIAAWNNRAYVTEVYHLEKRDSYVVVARLSPEFTARLVDRWQELEEKASALPDPISSAEPACAWADQVERNDRQTVQIADMREDVEAHHRPTKAAGSLNITEAVKTLGVRPKKLL
nr:Rha family transcriptional regulator [Rhodovulum sulfidophilum]